MLSNRSDQFIRGGKRVSRVINSVLGNNGQMARYSVVIMRPYYTDYTDPGADHCIQCYQAITVTSPAVTTHQMEESIPFN